MEYKLPPLSDDIENHLSWYSDPKADRIRSLIQSYAIAAIEAQASEVQQEPVAADAERYGERLNDASWAAVEAWNREVMGPMTGAIFNNIKGVVRAAILKYCEGYAHPAQQAKPQPLSDEQIADIFSVRRGAVAESHLLGCARAIEAAHGIQGS